MSSTTYQIEKPVRSDFDEWSKLFHDYIAFYNSKIEEDQYIKTFDRIIEGKNGLQALVVRQVRDNEKTMVGIAHFFPEQTPWSEKQILLLNGKHMYSRNAMTVSWREHSDNLDLFIDPSVRGAGLGRKLTQAVADVGKEMGCFRLQWVTKHDNTTARKLYDTLGESQFIQYRMNLQ
ncbi:histone acetyltransferase hpa2 [Fusarium heterosporum]|uniref:Histone acetyltransferase hpa2 n=1 Tax=Fusarium heterosporum TaxID=42747 RepID=A0A8H5T136_FUSHE|nr:histone acetyltransferase hpa2 [Fusarium heterosporum]